MGNSIANILAGVNRNAAVFAPFNLTAAHILANKRNSKAMTKTYDKLNGTGDHSTSHSTSPKEVERLVDRLKEAVGKESAASFARRAGVGESLMRQYLAGTTPGSDKIVAIAETAGVSLDWLLRGEGPKRPQNKEGGPGTPGPPPIYKSVVEPTSMGKMIRVPIVGTTQAGPPDRIWLELGYPVGFGDGELDAPAKDPHAYALRVVGNSMAPRILEGEVVLVYPSYPPIPGEECITRTTTGEVMVKLLSRLTDDEAILTSVNDQYDRIVLPRSTIDFVHPVAAIYRASQLRR